MPADDCLKPEMLNSFLSNQLTSVEREGIESHLSVCAACRVRLVELHQDIKSSSETHAAPRSLKRKALRIPDAGGRTGWGRLLELRQYATPALAAIVLVVIGVGGLVVWQARRDSERRTAGDQLREETRPSTAPQLVSPGPGEVIKPGEVEFRWSPLPEAQSYTFVLLDQQGDVITSRQTINARLVVNTSMPELTRGRNYFWYVQARLKDGTSVESKPSKFTLSEN